MGAALALAGSRSAAATPGYSDDDLALSAFAIGLELTARDLYDAAIAGGADEPLWRLMREQHEGYAHRLAGITGLSAAERDDATFEALRGGFEASDPTDAALDLENTAAATHTSLVGEVTDAEIAAAMASFVTMESRHAAVLTLRAGRGDDFDALFLNSATPLSPEGSS
ncbi:MAG: hypothetical protein HKN41_11855 [Ilumatobacter sp.]|nr:hypothetical protein [Ilumatobacter sp.]